MAISKLLLNKIKEFGLNSYEGKLWLALLSRGVSSAGELSDLSGVPRSRTYDVLETLEKKGFIVVKVGKPIKYLAVPPAEVVERVRKRIVEEAQERSNNLSGLHGSEVLGELDQLHNKGVELIDPTDRAASFRGREKVFEHLTMLVKNAEESIHLQTTVDMLQQKKPTVYNQLKKAAGRGVKVSIHVPTDVEESLRKDYGFANFDTKVQGKSRHCMIDNNSIFVFLTPESTHPDFDSAVWMEAPLFTRDLTKLKNL